MTSVDDINSLESEAGIIASLIHKPDFIFYSEYLLPNHFTNKENRCVYTAIGDLVSRGITTVDPYNIIESLNASEATRKYADELSVEKLNELMEMSDVLARHTPEEYKMLALLNHPKLLVLDEPVNGLDPVGIQELRELICQFPEEGITVLVSSHILSEIEQIADKIAIIVDGRVHYEGNISDGDNLEALFMDIVRKATREEM